MVSTCSPPHGKVSSDVNLWQTYPFITDTILSTIVCQKMEVCIHNLCELLVYVCWVVELNEGGVWDKTKTLCFILKDQT